MPGLDHRVNISGGTVESRYESSRRRFLFANSVRESYHIVETVCVKIRDLRCRIWIDRALPHSDVLPMVQPEPWCIKWLAAVLITYAAAGCFTRREHTVATRQ